MSTKRFIAFVLPLMVAASASAQTVTEKATCKLTNTAANKSIYEGPCEVKQTTQSSGTTVVSVKLADAEPFLFAGRLGQPTWQHGGEQTHVSYGVDGGIFKWSTFALVVAGPGAGAGSSGGQSGSAASLNDLIGARGSSAESQMASRGYRFVKKLGGATLWWHAKSQSCVSMAVDDGRVQSILDSPTRDCTH
jgi:hypothetical protein